MNVVFCVLFRYVIFLSKSVLLYKISRELFQQRNYRMAYTYQLIVSHEVRSTASICELYSIVMYA